MSTWWTNCKAVRRHVRLKERKRGFSEADHVEACLALLAAGGECPEDFEVMQGRPDREEEASWVPPESEALIESHKREAYSHYDGGRGYQPEVVLWVEQDLIVADEFRDGNVPAGKDPLFTSTTC